MRDLCPMLLRSAFFLSLFPAVHACAQTWELVTPVKTRSDLSGVQLVDPTTGYAIDQALGFVLMTRDAGASWQRKPYNLIDHPRVLWMWDDQRGIIAANAGRFYHTSDGWASASSVYQPTFGNISAMHFVDDTLGWAGSESGKIVRTIDGGDTWTLQTSGTTNAIVAMHFVNDTLGFAAATGAILLRTADAGANWVPLTTPITYNMRGIHFYDALNGIAVGLGGEIIRTVDGGDNWTVVSSPTTQSLLSLFVRDNLMLAVGNGGTVIRSTDGGQSWTAQTIEMFQDLLSVWIDPSGIGLLVGEARVYRTLDHGLSWTPVQVGTYHSMLNKVSFGTEAIGGAAGWQTMGGFENGAVRSTNGGRSWANMNAGAGQWLGIHLNADGTGWIGGGVGANRSTTDFFATTAPHPGPDVAIRCTWAFDANTAVVGGGYINGGVYRTSNGGSTWQHVLDGGNIYDLWFVNDTLGFAGGEGGGLARTHDGGLTWEWLESGSNAAINSIFFLNDTLGWYAGNGGAMTTDGGETWTHLFELPQYTMSVLFTDPDTGYAVNVSGYALRTTNGGTDWEYMVPEPFDAIIGDMTMVDGALIAVGRYGDVYRAELRCPATPHVPLVFQSGETLWTAWRPQIQWYLDGQPIPDATWPWITASSSGSYTVVVTDALGCTSAPSVPVQIINTSVEEGIIDAFTVMPNPSSGQLTIAFSDVGPHDLLLCDAQGRLLRRERRMGSTAVLDLQDLPAGLYVLREEGSTRGVRVVRE